MWACFRQTLLLDVSVAQQPLTPTERGCPEGQDWTKLLNSLACVCHCKDFNFACVMCMFMRQAVKFCACPYFQSLLCVPPIRLGGIFLQPRQGWSGAPLYQHFWWMQTCKTQTWYKAPLPGSWGARAVVPTVTQHLSLQPLGVIEIYDSCGKHKM